MPNYLRAYRRGSAAAGPLTFVASTPGIKRDGKDLDPTRWLLDNYRQNPVVLWAHDYMGKHLPIGRADVWIQARKLMTKITFDLGDAFAKQVERKYRLGFLNAVSVGWDDVQQNGDVFLELLDISAVPVPGDPDALMQRERVGLQRVYQDLGKKLYGRSGGSMPTGDLGTVMHILETNPGVARKVFKVAFEVMLQRLSARPSSRVL